jgi:hypothetical protein
MSRLEFGTILLRKQESKTLSNQSVRYSPNQYCYIIQQCSYLANISLMHRSCISQAQILRYMHILTDHIGIAFDKIATITSLYLK